MNKAHCTECYRNVKSATYHLSLIPETLTTVHMKLRQLPIRMTGLNNRTLLTQINLYTYSTTTSSSVILDIFQLKNNCYGYFLFKKNIQRGSKILSFPTYVYILSALTGHVKDNQRIRPSQHGFRKGRSCLINLTSFYDQVTHLVDEGKAVDVVHPDFSKAFHIVPHSILLQKLAAHGLDGCTLCWMKN